MTVYVKACTVIFTLQALVAQQQKKEGFMDSFYFLIVQYSGNNTSLTQYKTCFVIYKIQITIIIIFSSIILLSVFRVFITLWIYIYILLKEKNVRV